MLFLKKSEREIVIIYILERKVSEGRGEEIEMHATGDELRGESNAVKEKRREERKTMLILYTK